MKAKSTYLTRESAEKAVAHVVSSIPTLSAAVTLDLEALDMLDSAYDELTSRVALIEEDRRRERLEDKRDALLKKVMVQTAILIVSVFLALLAYFKGGIQ